MPTAARIVVRKKKLHHQLVEFNWKLAGSVASINPPLTIFVQSVVETVIGLVKKWEVASVKYRGEPENPALALIIVYQLTAQRLILVPIRTPTFE